MLRRWLLVLLVALLVAACRRSAEPLPELGDVGQFSLTDQAGEPATRARFAGKPFVAAFMFTRCPTICPQMTQRMKALQRKAKERSLPVQLVSFSVDPAHDQPAVLRRYAEEQGADLGNWAFLTGDASEIKRTSVEGFKLALDGKLDPSQAHFGMLHGSYLVLVDGAGMIRGYYRTTDDTLEQLLTDLARL